MGGFHGIGMDSIWNGDLIVKIYQVLYGIHGIIPPGIHGPFHVDSMESFHLESMDYIPWIPPGIHME